MVKTVTLPASPSDVGPHTFFYILEKKSKKQHIPPPKAVGGFAPGSTDDRLIIGEYSVSRKVPDQMAYAQKTLAARIQKESTAATNLAEPYKEQAHQQKIDGDRHQNRYDDDHKAFVTQPAKTNDTPRDVVTNVKFNEHHPTRKYKKPNVYRIPFCTF